MPTTPKKPATDKKKLAGDSATAGIADRLKKKQEKLTFAPNELERKVESYVTRRIDDMISYRKGLGIEQKWKEADEEYIPHELDFGTTRKRFETDQDTGLRSRMVPVGDVTQQWRQASSAPTLLAKIQTAVSIIIDQQPEADLVPLLKKYDKTTDLAYALWKRNWSITEAKEKLKLIVFDLIKYGWAAQRTYPRKVEYTKRVLTSLDKNDPENDRYEEKNLVWFNDIDRQRLDPNRTWIDELTTPYDPYSLNECYYEMDFSYDAADVELGRYGNFKYVKKDSQYLRSEQDKKTNRNQSDEMQRKRKDIVTIGFFESRHKDLFEIRAVKDNIPIYIGPLPNDDGYLSITQSMWILRKSNMPYGISLWEIIRQNKSLYDKMKNMGMDQLVLSIMKFGFFSGTNTQIGDGTVEIIPGQARQLTSSTGKPEVNWMEIPGPGKDFWQGIETIEKMMDSESGIVPTLEGEVTGKTLGEILHAKEAALKRIKVPVENIAWLIEQDAYLTLSWMSQVYSVPDVKLFSSLQEVAQFNQENEINHTDLFGAADENGKLMTDAQGNPTGPFEAHYLPQLALHLEDSDGKLARSNKSKFFQVGKAPITANPEEAKLYINPKQLKWKGIIKVIPRSIVDSSQTLAKAMKSEVFNMLVPLFSQPPELAAKPAAQILKVNEEDPQDWLPDAWLDYLKNGPQPPQPPQTPPGAPNPGAAAASGRGGPANVVMPQPQPMPQPTGPQIAGASGQVPGQASKLQPGSAAPDIAQLMGGKGGGQIFKNKL